MGGIYATNPVPIDSGSGGCCPRLRHEVSSGSGFFDLTEPSGKIIHVANSFAPKWKFQGSLIVRLIFLGLSLVTVFLQLKYFFDAGNTLYFFFYLTHWTLATGIAYLASALYVTLHRDEVVSQQTSAGLPSCIKLMWALFSISAPAGMSVFALYWTLDYDPAVSSIDFRNCMLHGGVAALVLIDGFVVASIPLRIKQILFYYGYCFTYVILNIIHDYSPLGDGTWKNEGDDDKEDSLYKILSWSVDFKGALVITAVQMLVANPTVYFLVWGLSLIRRQTVSVGNANEDTQLLH